MLQLDAREQRGFVRHRGTLRTNDVRMQGASGLGTARAKAERLARVTQEVPCGQNIHGQWWWPSLEHSSPGHEGLVCYSKEVGLGLKAQKCQSRFMSRE